MSFSKHTCPFSGLKIPLLREKQRMCTRVYLRGRSLWCCLEQQNSLNAQHREKQPRQGGSEKFGEAGVGAEEGSRPDARMEAKPGIPSRGASSISLGSWTSCSRIFRVIERVRGITECFDFHRTPQTWMGEKQNKIEQTNKQKRCTGRQNTYIWV